MLDDIKQVVVQEIVGGIHEYSLLIGYRMDEGIKGSMFMRKGCRVMDTNTAGESVVYAVFDRFLCSTVEEALRLRESLMQVIADYPTLVGL